MNIIATATSASKAFPPAIICSARSSPRASGRRATIFPAINDGRVKRDEIPDDTPSGAQGWFINTRRPKFADPRLREALNDAFDFEWTNKTIMYGAYLRTVSVFQNSDLMAQGTPSAGELALLEPFRARLPDEVFGEPYTPPVSDGSGEDRAPLRMAAQLLQAAGYVIQNGKRILPNGAPITVEFLIDEPAFEPHHMPFIRNLGVLGIDATVRVVDPVQYRARLENFDFDITIDRFSFSSTPGNSLRSYFFGAGRGAARFEQPRRHRRSGGRCADRRHHRGQFAPRAGDRLPCARPGDPRRPLLDSELV